MKKENKGWRLDSFPVLSLSLSHLTNTSEVLAAPLKLPSQTKVERERREMKRSSGAEKEKKGRREANRETASSQ